jgi:hypothetical protein
MIEFALIVIAALLMLLIVLLIQNLRKPINVVAPEVRDRIVPAINQYNPDAEITTVCPAPFAAASCSHDWETVNETILDMPHEKKLIHVQKCCKCGLVDKTVAATSAPPKPPPPPPAPPLPRSECKHRWEKEKVVTLDSAYEQMAKVRGSNGQWKKDAKVPDMSSTPEPWMFRKVYISVRVCTQCGEIDKSIVSNLEGEGADEPAES